MSQRSLTSHFITRSLVGAALAAALAAGTSITESSAAAITATSITGTPSIPDTLTANVTGGPATAYQWYDCTSAVAATVVAASSWTPQAGCTANSGTSSTYALVAADYGFYVTVAASETSGPTTGVAASVLVTEPAPAALGSPTFAVTSGDTNAGTIASTSGSGFVSPSYNVTTTYQWWRCTGQVTSDAVGTTPAGCSSISLATNSTYTFGVADVGDYVLFSETQTNAVGSATVYSTSTSTVIVGATPVNTVSPTLTGQTAFQVSVQPGSWSGHPAPSSYTESWFRCGTSQSAGSSLPGGCSAIAGSTTTTANGMVTYTFTSSDVNEYVLASVSANNGIASANTVYTATSAQVTGVAPAVASAPVITGTLSVGQTLSVSTGTWTGLPQPTAFSYAWYSCASNPSWSGGGNNTGTLPSGLSSCVLISSSGNTFMLGTGQTNDYIVARVSTNNGEGSFYYFTANTAAIGGATTSTTLSASITTPNVNGTFTGAFVQSGGSPTPGLSYRWYDCTSAVSASGGPQTSLTIPTCSPALNTNTGTSYTVLSSDVTAATGGGLLVVVTSTNVAGTVYAWSATTALANAAPSPVSVTESGSGLVGTAVTANATWTAIPAPSITYQWYDCPGSTYNGSCLTISGATASTYTPTTLAEVNAFGNGIDYVVVRASATNGSGSSGPIAAVGVLLSTQAPSNVTPPTVPASATTSTSLVANPGTWQGAPPPTFTYQWYVCTSVVASSGASVPSGCTSIAGATSGSYLPSGSYVNEFFVVAVTGSNGVLRSGNSTAVTVYSASTTSGLVANISITGLTITGTAAVSGTLTAASTVTTTGTYTTTYQWYRCTTTVPSGTSVPVTCAAISGATSSTYSPVAADVGYYITVEESATGTAGSTEAVAASTAQVTTNVPGAPTSVVATAGVGQVTLTWVAPTTGLAATSYTATSSTGGFTCTVSVTTCVIVGPLYGTTYTFTVTATNSYGTSPASLASNSVEPSEAVPAAPTGVTGVAASGSVAVSWTAAVNNGSLITLYTVTASPGGASCTTATLTCTVTGLTNGTSYTFTVTAKNAVGTGAASTASPAVTPAGPPAAPTGVHASTSGRGALKVTWTAATTNGAPVTTYLVTATGSSGSKTCSTSGLSCVVGGLSAGATYSVTVVAQSSAGNSSASSTLSARVASTATAPRVVRYKVTTTTIVLTLAKPSSNGGAAITTYQYFLNGSWHNASSKAGATLTIKGLKAGRSYRIAIRSVNAAGPGGHGAFLTIRTA